MKTTEEILLAISDIDFHEEVYVLARELEQIKHVFDPSSIEEICSALEEAQFRINNRVIH